MKGVKRPPLEIAESHSTRAMKAIRALRKIALDRQAQDGILDGLREELNKLESIWDETPTFKLPRLEPAGSLSERVAALSTAPGLGD